MSSSSFHGLSRNRASSTGPSQTSLHIPHSLSSDATAAINSRLMREELEYERLTYGGADPSSFYFQQLDPKKGASFSHQIKETAIIGDESSDERSRSGRERGSRSSKEEAGREEQPEEQPRSGRVNGDDGTWSSAASEEEEEDDPELRELEEREQIVDKYQQGPGACVDPWENPDFELYRKIDRFGFVHKEDVKEEDRRLERELRRTDKWVAMTKVWEKSDVRRNGSGPIKKMGPIEKIGSPPKKLTERVWKGIPDSLRNQVWPRLLHLGSRDIIEDPEIYTGLLQRAQLLSKDIKQIDLDINRTYRDHEAFRRRYDVKQKSLLNVLAAYSMYNTEVGYCQGMSQIVALFLMFMDEEKAFWCLHRIMVSDRHTMHGFFCPGFPKLSRFEEHFKRVLKRYRPKVYKHLEKEMIPYIYLTKWWFGCFLDRVPFPLALRIWDIFLLEGDVILTAQALNIMKMHEKTIRNLHMETFMEFIQSGIANDFGFPDDEVVFSLRQTLDKLLSDGRARPPPPAPRDLAERPTKALGAVLSRKVEDIRSNIAEIKSRGSRAQSMAGTASRSPALARRRSHSSRKQAAPPSPTPRNSLRQGPQHSPPSAEQRRIGEGGLRSSSTRSPPSSSSARPLTGRVPSIYDNLANGSGGSVRLMKDEHSGRMVPIRRDSSSYGVTEGEYGSSTTVGGSGSVISRSPSALQTRITRAANHITYVMIDDDQPPSLANGHKHSVV